MKIKGYTGKRRMAEDKEIKTLYYNAMLNIKAIGLNTIDQADLKQKVQEHLTNMGLMCTPLQLEGCLQDMLQKDKLYRVSKHEGYLIGLVQ